MNIDTPKISNLTTNGYVRTHSSDGSLSVDTSGKSKAFVISYPTATGNAPVWRAPAGITITAIHVLCVDGTNLVGRLEELDVNGLNPVVVGADITATAGTISTQTSFTNPGIASGNFVGWRNTSVSGSVSKVNVTFDYVIN